MGNRLTKTVSNAAAGTGLVNGTTTSAYDSNDRIVGAGHSYDNNGNEQVVNGQPARYDFENQLVSLGSGAVTYAYDAANEVERSTATGSA